MTNEKTILIVEDTKENVDLLLGLLDDYDLLVARDGQSALDITAEENVDLILLDIMMPGMDGFETCLRLKRDERRKDIPIIFITAKTDEESIERAYDVGGVDYVTKPFKPKELRVRVRTQLKIRSLINHLEYISSHDQLTDLYNRRMFFELAEKMFARETEPLFVMMFDIDRFKNINDTYGHPTGDKVIRGVADILAAQIRGHGVVGRVGGEEFAVVIHDTAEGAFKKVEAIRLAVENKAFTSEKGEDFKVTLSAGLAQAKDKDSRLDETLNEADEALLKAKGCGRNKSIFRQ